jgi:inorganic pyrophosphatase
MRFLILPVIALLLASCVNTETEEDVTPSASKEVLPDYGIAPLRDKQGDITAVIEIPAGTNHKYEYNYESKKYVCEIRNGKPRVVKFLPYPGNYGFIPGTLMDQERGGDGDALDVLVLSESIPQGRVIGIKPIATLKLIDKGEEDHKIIAVPANTELNVLNVTSFEDLSAPVKEIIKTWFTSYKGPDKMKFQSWESDSATYAEIEKWVK